jgi:hypothetical protein
MSAQKISKTVLDGGKKTAKEIFDSVLKVTEIAKDEALQTGKILFMHGKYTAELVFNQTKATLLRVYSITKTTAGVIFNESLKAALAIKNETAVEAKYLFDFAKKEAQIVFDGGKKTAKEAMDSALNFAKNTKDGALQTGDTLFMHGKHTAELVFNQTKATLLRVYSITKTTAGVIFNESLAAALAIKNETAVEAKYLFDFAKKEAKGVFEKAHRLARLANDTCVGTANAAVGILGRGMGMAEDLVTDAVGTGKQLCYQTADMWPVIPTLFNMSWGLGLKIAHTFPAALEINAQALNLFFYPKGKGGEGKIWDLGKASFGAVNIPAKGDGSWHVEISASINLLKMLDLAADITKAMFLSVNGLQFGTSPFQFMTSATILDANDTAHSVTDLGVNVQTQMPKTTAMVSVTDINILSLGQTKGCLQLSMPDPNLDTCINFGTQGSKSDAGAARSCFKQSLALLPGVATPICLSLSQIVTTMSGLPSAGNSVLKDLKSSVSNPFVASLIPDSMDNVLQFGVGSAGDMVLKFPGKIEVDMKMELEINSNIPASMLAKMQEIPVQYRETYAGRTIDHPLFTLEKSEVAVSRTSGGQMVERIHTELDLFGRDVKVLLVMLKQILGGEKMDFNIGPVNTKGTGRFGNDGQYGFAWTSPPATALADVKVEFGEFSDLMQFKTHLETCIALSISGKAHGCVDMFHERFCLSVSAEKLQKLIPKDPMCLSIDFELDHNGVKPIEFSTDVHKYKKVGLIGSSCQVAIGVVILLFIISYLARWLYQYEPAEVDSPVKWKARTGEFATSTGQSIPISHKDIEGVLNFQG